MQAFRIPKTYLSFFSYAFANLNVDVLRAAI